MIGPDAAFRARAEGAAEVLMRDTCTVSAPSAGGGAIDPNTWLPTGSAGAPIYSGRCRLRMMGRTSNAGQGSVAVAGDQVVTSAPMLSVPLSAPRIPVGAVVVMSSVSDLDAGAHLRAGLRLRVTGVFLGTDLTSQRVAVEAVTG